MSRAFELDEPTGYLVIAGATWCSLMW